MEIDVGNSMKHVCNQYTTMRKCCAMVVLWKLAIMSHNLYCCQMDVQDKHACTSMAAFPSSNQLCVVPSNFDHVDFRTAHTMPVPRHSDSSFHIHLIDGWLKRKKQPTDSFCVCVQYEHALFLGISPSLFLSPYLSNHSYIYIYIYIYIYMHAVYLRILLLPSRQIKYF